MIERFSKIAYVADYLLGQGATKIKDAALSRKKSSIFSIFKSLDKSIPIPIFALALVLVLASS